LSEKVSHISSRLSISPSQIIYPPCVEGPRGERQVFTKKGKRKKEKRRRNGRERKRRGRKKRKEEEREEEERTARSPSDSFGALGEFADILGKIRIHSIHRSRRFPKSMERDGWEIRG
jgi:hypothetical protein